MDWECQSEHFNMQHVTGAPTAGSAAIDRQVVSGAVWQRGWIVEKPGGGRLGTNQFAAIRAAVAHVMSCQTLAKGENDTREVPAGSGYLAGARLYHSVSFVYRPVVVALRHVVSGRWIGPNDVLIVQCALSLWREN